MNPRLRRVVLVFVAGFVLLSLLPTLPSLWATPGRLDLTALGALADRWSDGLLAISAVLLAGVLAAAIRRRRRSAQGAAFARALAAQGRVTVPATRSGAPGRPALVRRESRRPAAPASELEGKIRAAAKKGERIPVLARRHGISIDAVRVALGDALPEPAARPGSSFRGRQKPLPAKSPAAVLPKRRNPYGALA